MANASELCTSLRQAVVEKALYQTSTSVHACGEAAEGALKVRPATPKYSFPKDHRDHVNSNNTPAPGAYYDPVKHTTVVASFNSSIKSPERTKFGSSQRGEKFSSSSPGPATYNLIDMDTIRARTPSWGVGTGARDARLRNADDPGPGAYAIQSGIGKQALSVRPSSQLVRFGTSARDNVRPAAVPGPGTYEVTVIDGLGGRATTSQRPRSATTRFGTSTRMFETGRGGPGPAYSPIIAAVTPKSPNWSFAHGERAGFSPSATPGPGAYDSNATDALGGRMATTGHSNPAASPFPKGSRFASLGKIDGPAPGQYGTPAIVTESAPRVKFGQSSRDDGTKSSAAPGPGAYQPTVSSVRPRSATTRFGSSGRFGMAVVDTPGPDAYGVPDTSAVKQQSSRTRFGTSARDPGVSPHKQTPGPDAYALDGSFGAVKHRDPQFSFSHGGRFSSTGTHGPGPGEYGAPKPLGPQGPAFTMRAR